MRKIKHESKREETVCKEDSMLKDQFCMNNFFFV